MFSCTKRLQGPFPVFLDPRGIVGAVEHAETPNAEMSVGNSLRGNQKGHAGALWRDYEVVRC